MVKEKIHKKIGVVYLDSLAVGKIRERCVHFFNGGDLTIKLYCRGLARFFACFLLLVTTK